MPLAEPTATIAVKTAHCALCQSPIEVGESSVACPDCGAPYHHDCWRDVGGCGVYGCPAVPETDKRNEMEIPGGFWGQEHKQCPACNQQIQAMAVRCRHCGATFAAATPLSRSAFRVAERERTGRPRLQKTAIWLFVACAIPLLSAPAGIFAWVWLRNNREDIARLPGLSIGLLIIGIGVAAFETVVFLLALLLASFH